MMRVTNWQRWQRTKRAAAFTLVAVAVLLAGGFEHAEPADDFPYFGWIVLLTFTAAAIMANVSLRERQLRKGSL